MPVLGENIPTVPICLGDINTHTLIHKPKNQHAHTHTHTHTHTHSAKNHIRRVSQDLTGSYDESYEAHQHTLIQGYGVCVCVCVCVCICVCVSVQGVCIPAHMCCVCSEPYVNWRYRLALANSLVLCVCLR